MKYDSHILKTMLLFEQLTKAKLKDCVEFKDHLVFIVRKGDMAKALGKRKEKAKQLQEKLNRNIKIVEFDPTVDGFIKNLIKPLKITSIENDGEIVTIKGVDKKTNGLIIGARAQNLRAYEKIVQKYFDVKEIKVI